ncbi:MAG: U32 family peptidase, partial [Oscillospiraceae bacterium]
MGNIELLAPAGNLECLKVAVQSGADAVYFAGKNFGARNFADNFNIDEIKYAVEYCHLRNSKAYITVNTAVFDRELSELETYLEELLKADVDAFIVQDVGVIRLITNMCGTASIHGST